MKERKMIPISIAAVLIGVSCFSGCVGPWAIDTLGWEHVNLEGTTVRIWGQLTVSESSDNWNEGFVWDTESHQNWEDYAYRVWADNHGGFGLFSLDIDNLTELLSITIEHLEYLREEPISVDRCYIYPWRPTG
jgi:hypothetical protein